MYCPPLVGSPFWRRLPQAVRARRAARRSPSAASPSARTSPRRPRARFVSRGAQRQACACSSARVRVTPPKGALHTLTLKCHSATSQRGGHPFGRHLRLLDPSRIAARVGKQNIRFVVPSKPIQGERWPNFKLDFWLNFSSRGDPLTFKPNISICLGSRGGRSCLQTLARTGSRADFSKVP